MARDPYPLPGRRRYGRWLLLGLILVLGAALGWHRGWLELGWAPSRQPAPATLAERELLRQQLEALGRAVQIEREAHRLAQQDLQHLQARVRNLEEELARLRPLGNAEAKRTWGIEGFQLTVTDKERQYRYRVRILRANAAPGFLSGSARVSVHGAFGTAVKRLVLKELAPDGRQEHILRFQQFQDLEGLLNLPEGFSPDSLTLEIRPAAKGLVPLTEVFDWVVGG